MHRIIRFVDDVQLPPQHDWMLIRTPDGAYYFFVKRSRVTQEVLEQGWIAYEQSAMRHWRKRSA